jgi:hypothetical protein
MAVALGVGAWLRLVNIGADTDLSDEGIRGLQLRMMAAGFKPVAEIYSSQGPLSIPMFYPAYATLGGDIAAARIGVVVYALVAAIATAAIAWRLCGAAAGVVAMSALLLSPTFLETSRLAFVEVPSLAPALVALALVVGVQGRWRRPSLALAAGLFAVGVLAKPMAIVVAVPMCLFLLGDSTRRAASREAALMAIVGGVVTLAVVIWAGPRELMEQLVGYRLAARSARGWELATNLGALGGELRREWVGVWALAALGCVAGLSARRQLLPVALWLSAGLAMLTVYSPLWPKHVAYAMPPVAILAGAGAAWLAGRGRLTAGGVALVLVGLLAVDGVRAGEILAQLTRPRAVPDLVRHAEDREIVAALTGPDDYIVMDDAYPAMLTGRLVPPGLVDLSWNRIVARALTNDQAIAQLDDYRPTVVLIQDDHLGRLPRVVAWLDREYLLVKSIAQRRPERFRRLYVRPETTVDALEGQLGAVGPVHAEMGGLQLRALGVDGSEVRAGNRLELRLEWMATAPAPAAREMTVMIRDQAGRAAHESQWPIGDGAQGTPTWRAGRWLVQVLRLPIDGDTPPGDYSIVLQASRGNATVGGEVTLGRLAVTR